MNIVGHEAALSQVPDPLPPALLLTGPEGVGKRRIALGLARSSGVSDLDFQNLGVLNRDGARRLVEHHATHPVHGDLKVSVADLTHAGPEASNAILKLIEEPPAYSRVILHSDREPLLTLRSRCFNVRFGTLTDEQVATVLDGLGVTDPEAAARFSQGRVSLGLAYSRGVAARGHAEAVLSAVARRDAGLVEATLAEALKPDPEAGQEATETKRSVFCGLLKMSLRSSLTMQDHALASLPMETRLLALDVLDGRGRPALRARTATWVLLDV